MIDMVLDTAKDDMERSVEALQNDLATISTGRASTGLVDKIQVECYGQTSNLQQVAVISVPEPQMIVVRPFDPGTITDIERSLMKSDLGITPSNDGKIIRLPIPPLTEDRRKELTKQVSKRMEDGKVSVRQQRRNGMDDLKQLEKDKDISEDEYHEGSDKLQKLTDEYIEKVTAIGKAKSDELMSI
ncbi:MAG: ribosome recycling factor [Chloroflexota bacterium]